MRTWRVLTVIVIAAVILVATWVFLLRWRRDREATLLAAFPPLAYRGSKPVELVPDPLIRPAPGTSPYDSALKRLLAAQYRLTREGETLSELRGDLARREEGLDSLRGQKTASNWMASLPFRRAARSKAIGVA